MEHSYEKLCLSVISVPASVQFSGLIVRSLVSAPATRAVYGIACQNFCFCAWHLAVDQVDFENDGACACHRWSPVGWLSDPWSACLPCNFMRVMVGSSCILILCTCHPCNWPNWFSNCWSLRPPSVQFTKLILNMLACAPATGAVKRIDCQIPGLCACHPCSLPEWWLDPWSLHLPPTPTWRFDMPLQALGSSFCFSGFQAGSFRAMLSFILLLWFALCVLEAFLIMRHIQCCHVLLSAEIGKICSQTKTTDNGAFDAWSVWSSAARANQHVMAKGTISGQAGVRTIQHNMTAKTRSVILKHHDIAGEKKSKDKGGQDCFPQTSQKHKTNFSNISKTLTKLLKHAKDTKQTSQTSQRHGTNISNT